MVIFHDDLPHASNFTPQAIKELQNDQTWVQVSYFLNLNFIEKLWNLFKCQIYSDGRQNTSWNNMWREFLFASVEVELEQIKKQTDWMEGSWLELKRAIIFNMSKTKTDGFNFTEVTYLLHS